jgi:hypothetical protein
VAASLAGIWLNGMQNGAEAAKTNNGAAANGVGHANSNGRNGHHPASRTKIKHEN